MAVLPMPSSIRLHPHIQLQKGRMVNSRTKQSHVSASSATITTTTTPNPTTNPTHKSNQVLKLNKIFDDLSLGPIGLVADHQVLLKNKDTNKCSFDFLTPETEDVDHGVLVEQVGIVMRRLETVVEKMRVMELEKLKSKTKGGQAMSLEESMMAEEMSREIVGSFLEKPIEYLMSKCGRLEDKLMDLNFLVGILEESCGTCVETKKIHVCT